MFQQTPQSRARTCAIVNRQLSYLVQRIRSAGRRRRTPFYRVNSYYYLCTYLFPYNDFYGCDDGIV